MRRTFGRPAIVASLTLAVVSVAAIAATATLQRDDLSAADRAKVDKVLVSPTEFYKPEAFERMSAGAATSTKLVNQDAFGDGWMIRVKLMDPGELEDLLDASAYQALVE